MMFFSFAFQLCWTVIAIISFVRGQQLDQNTATATANMPTSTPDKVVDSQEALVARWTDVMSTLICSDCLLTFANRKTITTETLDGEHQYCHHGLTHAISLHNPPQHCTTRVCTWRAHHPQPPCQKQSAAQPAHLFMRHPSPVQSLPAQHRPRSFRSTPAYPHTLQQQQQRSRYWPPSWSNPLRNRLRSRNRRLGLRAKQPQRLYSLLGP
jgi:hypothetical protein